jgi:GNAT superfamily N-acetyltransferase
MERHVGISTETIMVSLRTARLTDAGDITRLAAQLGYEVDAAALADRLDRILARSGERFLVAEIDGRVVGWLHAGVWEDVEAEAFAVIGGLVVDRAHRNRGIGRVLLDDAERWAREQGVSVVRLWSSTTRTDAHRFYQRMGYTAIKTQHSFAKCIDPTKKTDLNTFVPKVAP